MRSYAAGNWRCSGSCASRPSLPYLFAAFRIAATASVVGAIIGELPSSIQDGLGGAILNFNQYYSLSPQKLWATNIVAALLGIALLPRRRRSPRSSSSAARRSTSCERERRRLHAASRRRSRRAASPRSQEHRPRRRAGRVRLADRPVGLRQVDAAAHHRRPRRADDAARSSSTARPRGRRGSTATTGSSSRTPVLFDWRTVAKNIALPLEMLGWNRARRSERVERDARARRADGLREATTRGSSRAACSSASRSRARSRSRRRCC